MILHPDILALLVSSAAILFLVLVSAAHGIRILDRWDLRSGSEGQLALERRTYLVSTLLSYALVFQLASLFLYVYASDGLASFFTGAMCAAGTLHVTPYGYPVLLLKVVNFLLAGLWLILNHVDNRGHDYPLIRPKYLLLLGMVPFLLAEGVLQAMHFLGMESDVITSCCGSLFSANAMGVASEVASLPPRPAAAAFYGAAGATVLLGLLFWRREKGGYLLSSMSGATMLLGAAALVSVICLYFYEMPSHHCPFCLLQGEYGHAGYPLYLTLLGGGVSGVGVGVLMPFRDVASIRGAVPGVQKRLALLCAASFALFAAISCWPILFSDFTLR